MEIEVIIPGEFSSAVLSQPQILEAVQSNSAKIVPISNRKNHPELSHDDFGATAVAILGTAAAAAAAKGLFDLFRTIIVETQKNKRQKEILEHECQILKLRIDNKVHEFNIDDDISDISERLEQISNSIG